MRIIKLLVLTVFVVLFLGLFLFQAWLRVSKSYFSVEPLLYWLLFIAWITVLLNFKLRSVYALAVAFGLFLISAIMVTVGFSRIGEVAMRISFMGWIIGIIQALFEYKLNRVKK